MGGAIQSLSIDAVQLPYQS
uniref:Uncharacterized protein n=1 Tax=Arundo donax TaxID=35708 RepID=A0A0A9AV14_ARUDO